MMPPKTGPIEFEVNFQIKSMGIWSLAVFKLVNFRGGILGLLRSELVDYRSWVQS